MGEINLIADDEFAEKARSDRDLGKTMQPSKRYSVALV